MCRNGWALAILLCAVPPDVAVASGYHPPFDEAFAKARLVAMGKVTRFSITAEDNPYPEVDPGSLPLSTFYMDVEQAFKGDVKAGDRLVIWDPYGMSTASYYLNDGVRNLTFLVRADLARHADDRLYDAVLNVLLADVHGKPTVKDTDLGKFRVPVYQPIRNIDEDEEFPEEFVGWLKLLDLRLNPPDDLLGEYRRIARTSENRYVLHYVVTHWSRPLAAADVALFKDVIARHADDPYVSHYAFEAINAQGEHLSDEDLAEAIKQTPWYGQDTILAQVNAGNIDACRDALFGWLLDDETDYTDDDVIAKLAELAPEYLQERLRDTDLPFWYFIPALKALGINGAAVGKDDISPDILELEADSLSDVGAVVEGDVSDVASIIRHWSEGGWCSQGTAEEWRTALPLLVPALQTAGTSQARAIRTIMGTLGHTLGADGVMLEPAPPPVEPTIELVTPKPTVGGPVVLRLVETTLRPGVVLCTERVAEWSVETPSYWTTRGPGTHDMWEEPEPARDRFIELQAEETRSAELDISDAVETPGTYKIGVLVYYPYRGSEYGLDAWTGAVWADVLEFTVP
jgi:hypothetical protein